MNEKSLAMTLYNLCLEHVRHLASTEKDAYGIGFHYDESDGVVYLVANTVQFLDEAKVAGEEVDEHFVWDIGNWKYPGGAYPSSSIEQVAFDDAWSETLTDFPGWKEPGVLKQVCSEALRLLHHDGQLNAFSCLAGLTVVSSMDEDVIHCKSEFDRLMQR